jgi:bis(5'-nucleosyl)-tetraphosphatase (symmetrical)
MAHAGIPHIWNVEKAAELALELEAVIRGDRHREYFEAMYGNQPNYWSDDLQGMDRWRSITNYFTRMRLMNKEGVLDFSHKGALDGAPKELTPWFEMRQTRPLDLKLLFGHWAALEGHTGHPNILALDTDWCGQGTDRPVPADGSKNHDYIVIAGLSVANCPTTIPNVPPVPQIRPFNHFIWLQLAKL